MLHRVVILGRAPNSNQLRGQDAGPLGIGKEAGDRLAESYKIFKQSRNYANYDLTAYVRTLVADVSPTYRLKRQQLLGFCRNHRWDIPIVGNPEFYKFWDRFLTTQDEWFYQPVGYEEAGILSKARASAGAGRSFCLFDDGRVGWVPELAEFGDRIAIFLGGTVPILLRPSGNDYIVLGEAYVDEMMDGQAFEEPEFQVETITLV